MSGLSVYVYRATGERDGRPRATDGDTVLHLDGERMPTLAIGHCGALLRHYKLLLMEALSSAATPQASSCASSITSRPSAHTV